MWRITKARLTRILGGFQPPEGGVVTPPPGGPDGLTSGAILNFKSIEQKRAAAEAASEELGEIRDDIQHASLWKGMAAGIVLSEYDPDLSSDHFTGMVELQGYVVGFHLLSYPDKTSMRVRMRIVNDNPSGTHWQNRKEGKLWMKFYREWLYEDVDPLAGDSKENA